MFDLVTQVVVGPISKPNNKCACALLLMRILRVSISFLPEVASLWFASNNLAMSVFYAVRRGRIPGIYSSWDECKTQVNGYPKPIYKKFSSESEAIQFLAPENQSSPKVETVTLAPEFTNKPKNMVKLGFSIHDKKTPNLTSNSNIELRQECNCSAQLLELRNEFEQLKSTVESLQIQINSSSTSSTNRRKADLELPNTSNKKFKSNTGDDLDVIYVYTDGACTKNGRKNAKAGLGVYFGDDHHLNVSERIGGRQTNNRAEIHAAVRALEQIKLMATIPKRIVLYTDSNFLIQSITMWIKKWKRNGWKLQSGQEVKNKEDFEKLDRVMQGLNIDWVHVKGHAGIKGNEAADKLAVASLDKPDPLDVQFE